MPAGRPKGLSKPPGSGRKAGTPNKRSIAAMNRKAAKGLQPLEFLVNMMRDDSAGKMMQLDAAKAAAPYLHARRAPEDAKGRTVPPMFYNHPNLESDDEK